MIVLADYSEISHSKDKSKGRGVRTTRTAQTFDSFYFFFQNLYGHIMYIYRERVYAYQPRDVDRNFYSEKVEEFGIRVC